MNAKNQAKYQVLIDTAAQMFVDRPFESLDIKELAERSGVKRSTIYAWMKESKKPASAILLEEITNRIVDTVNFGVDSALCCIDPRKSSSTDKLLAILRSIRSSFESKPFEGKTVLLRFDRPKTDAIFAKAIDHIRLALKDMRNEKLIVDIVEQHYDDAQLAGLIFSSTWHFLRTHYATSAGKKLALDETELLLHLQVLFMPEVQATIAEIAKAITHVSRS
jgi:transcriptional regulator with XRE-family HTH domain